MIYKILNQGRIDIEEINTRWERALCGVDENLKTIDVVLKKTNFTKVDLSGSIERLETNAKKIEELYEDISEKAFANNATIFRLPAKKFKAIVCASAGTLSWTIGLISISVFLAHEIIAIPDEVKWTGFGFCIAGAVMGKVNDYLWNSWGNEESSKRQLLELNAKASMFVQNTNTILQILKRFLDAMNIEEQQNEKQKSWRETRKSFKKLAGVAQTLRGNNFDEIFSTLREQVNKKGYRESRIFTVFLPPPGLPRPPSIEDLSRNEGKQEEEVVVEINEPHKDVA